MPDAYKARRTVISGAVSRTRTRDIKALTLGDEGIADIVCERLFGTICRAMERK